MLFDGQGRCLTVNESGRDLMPCGSRELKGSRLEELWTEGQRPLVSDAVARVLGGRCAAFEASMRDGAGERWWSVVLSPILDAAGQVSEFIAIGTDISERRQAEERTQRHLENMKALCTVSLAITANLDLDATLSTLLDQVTTRLRLDAASVLLLEESTLTLRHAASRGFRTDRIRGIEMRIGEGHAGRAAREQRRIVIPDLAAEATAADPGPGGRSELSQSLLVRVEGFRAYLSLPLVSKARVTGVLEVFNRTPFEPDEETLAFLETLAGQGAVALDSARLFAEIGRSRDELRVAYDTTIEGWARALDYRDRETEGHSRRVTELTVRIAEGMGLAGEELRHLRWGALLHDIGKLGVPDGILLKEGPLTPEETTAMRRHAEIGHDILAPIAFLQPALAIPGCHHEWWDGSGYPRGLRGTEIPLGARIFAIVDVWDALGSDRPYRPAWPRERVVEHLRERAGTHFDPELVERFLETVGEAPAPPLRAPAAAGA